MNHESITIDTYSIINKGDMECIWVNWLKNSMGILPQQEDLEEVRNPVKSYVEGGGAVFYANRNEECLGVVAVKKLNNMDYEFCKLVVIDKARGLGLGRKLVEKCIRFVKDEKGNSLYLQSFNKLEIALKMYKKMGFRDSSPPKGMLVVDRTEIIMKISL